VKARVVVLGYVVRGPLAGPTWHHLQYLLGLADLGHDAWFVELNDDYEACYDPRTHAVTTDPTYGLGYAGHVFDRTGFGDRWAFYDCHTGSWAGPAASVILDVLRSADAVINVSGVNDVPPVAMDVPRRVLIDTDPGFTQVRHLQDVAARDRAAAHTEFFTFAENVGRGARLPDDGLPWLPTRQPVHLAAWPVVPAPKAGAFTTVMQWDSYTPVEHDGVVLGMKSASFAQIMDVPTRLPSQRFEIAVGSATAPRGELAAARWLVRDPVEITRDPWTYQEYLQASKAELSPAKHGYVVTNCGWFSERSAAYLASARPVVAQDTGFSRWLPCGEGLLAFTNIDEAVDAVHDIAARYSTHVRRARELVVEHFDARRVVAGLL
jgi:hypothetical protein